jgi:peptide deformylase
MLEVMDEAEGVGLAASQVGVLKRLFVWRHPESGEPSAFVNPVIVESSAEQQHGSEGCLSVPGFSVEVPRAARVVVEACDLEGRPLTFEGTDLLARIMQHEIDHLDGMLIVDRTSAEERRRVLREHRAAREAEGRVAR